MFAEKQILLFKTITRSSFSKSFGHGIQAIIATLIVLILPEKYWYHTAFRISFLYRLSIIRFKRSISIAHRRAEILNTLLGFLTRANKPFPIPCSLSGFDLLSDATTGTAFCTVHLPLVKVAISAALTNGFKIDAAIVASPNANELMSVWGITQKIPTIQSSSQSLFKAKKILTQNGCVLLMLDAFYGDNYSPNIMHVAGLTGSKAVFFIAELSPNGMIDIQILPFPNPFCTNEIAIAENIQYVSDTVQQVHARYRSQSFWQ